MKNVISFVVAIVAVLFIVSCEQPTMLSVSQTALSFENKGGNQSVTITANKLWSISSNQSWLLVSPPSGEGNASISVSCEANTTYDSRTGTITITSEELTQTISVTQVERKGLNVAQTDYEITNEAQQLDVIVNSNFNYAVNTNASWISYLGTKALKETKASFQITENEGKERMGTVILSGEGLTIEIRIKQAASPYIEFEDANFKAYCIENFDINHDGKLSYDEALLVTSIDVKTEIIASLKEIEYFENLQSLTCKPDYLIVAYGDPIRFYNSKNEEIVGLLTNLDISHNLKLQHLNCEGNQLTTLDVSQNSALLELNCKYNPMTTLTMGHNTALAKLNCEYNRLTTLDVSRNTALISLECVANRLTALDVSSNALLAFLACGGNPLTTLDVSKNTALNYLECGSNQLTSLDVSRNTALKTLSCSENQVTSLDVSNNTELSYLSCHDIQLTTLDVSRNTLLVYLYCHRNPRLKEIWLKTNQTIPNFEYDTEVATIKYK